MSFFILLILGALGCGSEGRRFRVTDQDEHVVGPVEGGVLVPPLTALVPGNLVAAYDLTAAVAGQPLADAGGNAGYAIAWPTQDAPAVIAGGLVWNGQTSACLDVPAGISHIAAVSVLYSKGGEDYAGGNLESYPAAHALFAGKAQTGNVYSAVKFATGVGQGSFYHPQVVTETYNTTTLDGAVGTHLLTFVAGTAPSLDQVAIDGSWVTSYLTQGSSGAEMSGPFVIGCEHAGSWVARGTISFVVLWGAVPTVQELSATAMNLEWLAAARNLANGWGAAAHATSGNLPELACVGDSHTSLGGSGTWCSVANLPGLNQSYHISVLASSGKLLSDMIPELGYELYRNVSVAAPVKVVVLDGGTNDMLNNVYVDDTPYYAQWRQAASVAHAAGARYVQQTFFSMCASAGSELLQRDRLNTWIRANWPSYADGISDIAANPLLGKDGVSCTDPVHFDASMYHLTAAGKAEEGLTAQAAINNVTGSTANAPTLIQGGGNLASGQNFVEAQCSQTCALVLPAATYNAGWSVTVHMGGNGSVSVSGEGLAAATIAGGGSRTFTSVANSDSSVAGASWIAN